MSRVLDFLIVFLPITGLLFVWLFRKWQYAKDYAVFHRSHYNGLSQRFSVVAQQRDEYKHRYNTVLSQFHAANELALLRDCDLDIAKKELAEVYANCERLDARFEQGQAQLKVTEDERDEARRKYNCMFDVIDSICKLTQKACRIHKGERHNTWTGAAGTNDLHDGRNWSNGEAPLTVEWVGTIDCLIREVPRLGVNDEEVAKAEAIRSE